MTFVMSTCLVTVFAALSPVANCLRGGQVLKEPFSYTVYIWHQEPADAVGALVCLGVLQDSRTVITSSLCRVEADGNHFVRSPTSPEGHNGSDVLVQNVLSSRDSLNLDVLSLQDPLELDGTLETVKWDVSNQESAGRVGVVPTFGYPPKVGAMQLINVSICIDLLLNTSSELPQITGNFECAVRAKEPVNIDNVGLVQPGEACEELGAPFILNGDLVVGLMVFSSCNLTEPMAFFLSGKNLNFMEPITTTYTTALDVSPEDDTTYIESSVRVTKEIKRVNPKLRGGMDHVKQPANSGGTPTCFALYILLVFSSLTGSFR